MMTAANRVAPVHLMAWAGIAMAILAGVLALYGAMHAEKHLAGSPLREARGSSGLPPQPGKFANYSLQIVAYVLPFWLGLAGALTGGWAMKAVQQSNGKYAGNTLAVFSMMVGGLAAVVAGCMMVSLYVWPRLPSLYTT